MERIAISLAGHTNLGKTTLARTLLRQDIGVVDDRPHVTDVADGQILEKDQQAEIVLWDLPGFGDSLRLKLRLMEAGLFAWLRTVFDRWTDRPLWCSQKSLENAKNDADVILYLVDANAQPSGSAEVHAEMDVLGSVGKPVILLLNQTGLPDHQRDEKLAREWREAMEEYPFVHDCMPLDGWMRCWVQEGILFQRIAPLLTTAKRPHYERLISVWKTKHHDEVFKTAVSILAEALFLTAGASAEVDESLLDKAASALTHKPSIQMKNAKDSLAESLVARSSKSMGELLKAHKLEGISQDRVDSLLEGLKTFNPGAPPELLAVLGGIGSGALGGLLADIKSGGMTFGGGAVAGALLGGLAVYALGRGYQMIKGADGVSRLRWSKEFLLDEWKAWAMRYLMVAHFGRGQGQWQEPIPSSWPTLWQQQIDSWTITNQQKIEAALGQNKSKVHGERLHELMDSMLRHILTRLYSEEREQEKGNY